MSLPRFSYFQAKSLDQAVTLLEDYYPKARVIAGGTDLLGAMKDRINTPEFVIDIKDVKGLEYIREESGVLKIGSLTRLCEIERSPLLVEKFSLLSEAARMIASPQIRNMATLGGNLCQDVRCWYYRASPWCGAPFHCYRKGGERCYVTGHGLHDHRLSVGEYFGEEGFILYRAGAGPAHFVFLPEQDDIAHRDSGDGRYHSIFGASLCHAVCPSDMAIALSALGAKARVVGEKGERTLPVEQLWLNDAPWTSLERSEIITEIQVAAPKGVQLGRYLKFRFRKALDFAIVSLAAALEMEGEQVKEANIVLGGVAPVPWRARNSESLLRASSLKGMMIHEAAEAAVVEAKPSPMSAYKVALCRVVVKEALLSISQPLA
jgi:xanthine dehydrogenase YagS FAD-binding subunit